MLHQPALLQSVIDGLKVKKGLAYLDGTVGSGGHAIEIVKKGGVVYGIDVDPQAIERARLRLNLVPGAQFKLKKINFLNLEAAAESWGVSQFAGILFDLGLSSEQLADGKRGFSFQLESPLDMRADPELAVKAADLLAGLNQGELTKLLTKLGEEPKAKAIARGIIKSRQQKPLVSTRELVDIINTAYGGFRGKTNNATRTFQALRIAVNDEINNLKAALPQAETLLAKGGRLAIISFHSLEDRQVKQFMKNSKNLKILTNKPITASDEELKINPRSRSAKLRLAEKK